MPTIRPIVHVGPVPKAKKPGFGTKAKKATAGARRTGRTTYGNATSSRGKAKDDGRKFGRPNEEVRFNDLLGRTGSFQAGAIGGMIGAGFAPTQTNKTVNAQAKQIRANQRQIYSNSRKRRQEFGKARYKLITDLGTTAARGENRLYRKYPGFSTTFVAGGAAAGAATTHYGNKSKAKDQKKVLARQRGTLTMQQRKYKEALGKSMTTSAFGIDHGEFSKAGSDNGNKYSTGRAVAASALGFPHAAVAAKKGKKGRAAGRVLGYTLGGNVAGSVAGAALTRGNVGATNLAGSIGGGVGAYKGFRANNRRGYYKKQS